MAGQPAQVTGKQVAAARARIANKRVQGEANFVGALLAGFVAAAVGAAIWAVITDVTGFQIGWMAVGVGFIVGVTVRSVGKGSDMTFGVLGAGLSLLGCLAGNLLAVAGIIAQEESLPLMNVLAQLDGNLISELMSATFSPIDLVFYGIAVYEGYKLSLN